MRRVALLLCCLAMVVGAELVDRLAIVVGHQVITEQQLDEEIRVTAFLNHEPVSRTVAARRAAADRLIQQALIRREMELSHYPLPGQAEVNQYIKGIERQWAGDFSHALAEYQLTAETLRDHLALQLTTLRFIQYRFQPGIDVPEAAMLSRYQKKISEWQESHHSTPPTFEQAKESIREELLEERTDRALAAWMEEMRKRVPIRYVDTSLQ